MRFDTRLVQAGQRPDGGAGDVVPPIHVAATYERGVQDPLRYFYGRGENPTREALEECLAALEGVRHATVYSSGQAAAATVLTVLAPGQRLVASDDVYGGTHALLARLAATGVAVDYADLADPVAAEGALAADDLGMVWVETPTNPLLKVADLAAVCRRAHAAGAVVVVDNTLASPVLQQPLQWADVTLYSTTKSIAGHLDAIGGALVYDDDDLHERFRAYRNVAGNVPGGLDCYLVRRGLKTLTLRVERQSRTAAAVAALLQDHPAVGAVHYPGLPGHPGHAVAARQMAAAGSIVSFDYLGDAEKLMDRVRVFAPAVSLGGVQSLIEVPALMTHSPIPRPERVGRGIGDDLVRLSVGIEDADDLLDDLRAALRPD